MDLPSKESSELTELMLNPEITETLLPDAFINEEAGFGFLQEMNAQAPTDLGCDTYNMPLMSTSMLADLPRAEVDFDLTNRGVGFEFDWPQDSTMDRMGQFDLNIQQGETNANGTWPLDAFDLNHELSLQPFATMPQSQSIETPNLDTFLSDMWPIEGPIGDQALGDCIETSASSSAENGQFEGLNSSLNQVWRPSLDWSTDFNNPDQSISIGGMTADGTHHSNDAVWSSDLLNIFNASSHVSTNLGAQISHDTLSHQNVPTFDGKSAQSILSIPSGAPTQELHSNSEPSLAAPRAETHLPISTVALPLGTIGPVLPVTLPPLRRGGKKGPLSAQERQARKQIRRRGVCIRCRRLKQKCNGGLPCESCLLLSKATLYISPCAVANFLDIVKLQPYFLGPSPYALGSPAQQKTLEHLDKLTVVDAALLVHCLGQGGADGKIQAQTFPPYKTYALVNWAAAADILESMLEKTADDGTPMSDHLSQIAVVQPEPSSWHQRPIVVPIPPQYQEKGKDLDLYLLFCALPEFKFMSWNNPMSYVSDEEATDVGCKTLHILTWITKRWLEQILFQRLQVNVNKLNTLSYSQLLFTAALILKVITFGNRLAHLKFTGEHTEQTPSVDLPHRHSIRQSLFCYLKIVIDRLPAWSDFWKQQTEHIVPITPEILRLSLSDLEIYDKRILTMGSCLKQSVEWYENFGETFEAESPAETDDTHLARLFSSSVDGSYANDTIKAMIPRMNQFFQSKIRKPLESIKNAIEKGISPSLLRNILFMEELLIEIGEMAEALLKILKEVEQRLRRFWRADADTTTDFDLMGSVSVPSIRAEAVDQCSELLDEALDSAEAGTH
ncbi:hypothetical protein BKA59DRAFT_532877 [Fusarium tricinctum]|uniref:Zn(2)-C6 fungal-type domain-containing protein n=1 Tax=Fusarium tricinctum TaxID=61284 RepID=A0A8K0W762_9HYPO|nr:hypothetical protein BKA59DRAFT_532877 [Fusarium tricinctum]